MALLTSILGITGNVTSILLLLSPMPTFWVIVKKKTTGCFSAQPYLFGLLSALLWAFYGFMQLKKGGFLVLITISSISSAFYSLYLTLYLFFGSKSQREKTGWFLLAIAGFFVSTIISSTKFLHGNDSLMAVGLLCTIVSGFSNASPLSIVRRVIKTKSVQYMPLSLSLGLFINGVTWLAYSFCIKDIYLLITNGVGVSLGVLQLALYTFFRVYGVQSKQVVDENELNMKANSIENVEKDMKVNSGRVSRTSSNAAGKDFNFNIVDLTQKVSELNGKASRTSSNAGGLDFNINIVDLPSKTNDLCVVSDQSISRGGSLRKLPTPRAIVIDAHVLVEELSRNTT